MVMTASVNYSAFVVFLLLVDAVLIYRLSRTPGFGREESWITKLMVASFVCALSDALCVGVGDAAGVVGNYIFNAAFDLSTIYIACLFFFYCAERFDSPVARRRCWRLLVTVPVFVFIVMLLASIWTGWIFSIMSDGTYVRGPLFFLFVFVLANGYTVASIVVCLVGYTRRYNEATRAALPQCIKYVIPLLLGTYLQFFFTQVPSSNMGLTFTLLLIFMDNQERLLKKKIIEADKANLAKSEFLSRMSHDVRTPINGIVGMIRIASSNADDPDRVRECLEKVDGAAEQLLTLVNDVLDMSKIEAEKITFTNEAFDLVDMLASVDNLHMLLAQEKGVELISHGADELQHRKVVSSPVHVRSVLVNLVSNAVKYTEPGGRIDCSTRELPMHKGRLLYEFKVSDTGIGMSEDFAKRVFEPFTQESRTSRTSYEGSGLGLAIVKRIVDEMGGTITLDTKAGEGSTFIVVLPFDVPDENSQEVYKPGSDAASLNGMRILLVDDNELNLDIAQFVLEESGAQVTVALNGQEAIDLLLDAPKESFDAVVMDVMMPVMDGLETTRRIRKLDRTDIASIPVVGMSANAFCDDIASAKAAGMDEYVVKPISSEKLLIALNSTR